VQLLLLGSFVRYFIVPFVQATGIPKPELWSLIFGRTQFPTPRYTEIIPVIQSLYNPKKIGEKKNKNLKYPQKINQISDNNNSKQLKCFRCRIKSSVH
jgi:hypothetical protein